MHPLITITKEVTFEAAHVLPDHDGKCGFLHGHSYKAIIEIVGPIIPSGPQAGMVVDYYHVTNAWKSIEPLLDHRFLNETLGDGSEAPYEVGTVATTAEYIAGWILERMVEAMREHPGVVNAVIVRETATSSARADT